MAWSVFSFINMFTFLFCLDSVVERKLLRERIFPKLRDYCRHTRGLDFRVIDPFESSDPHRWPDECSRRQMIKECRESSAGPFLLVNKLYGTARLPVQVEVSEFQLLLRQSQEAGVSSKELERVYRREENTVPPSYCLRPPHRSTESPQYNFYPVLFFLEADTRAAPTDEQLHSQLCDNFLPGLVTSCHHLLYTTTTLCDPCRGYSTARRHVYAESLCQQVNADLMGLIDNIKTSETKNQQQLVDVLSREQAERDGLCKSDGIIYKVKFPILQVRTYVTRGDKQRPLVILGGPCTGKTVLLAHCAQQVFYFVSRYLHKKITQCPQCVLKPDVSLTELRAHFRCLLSNLPSSKQPLVLILTGLDQIQTDSHCLSILESLPSPLPPAVKLILTVSTSSTQILRAIRVHYTHPCRRPCVSESTKQAAGYVSVQLGLADRKECGKLLVALLGSSGRRVTSGQQSVVNHALTSCGRTLYVRLLHVHASLWRSDSDVTESSLPVGIHASIAAFLDHLEKKHGSSLVAHAVSYLTLSRCGLPEVDLADLLSTGDGVLSEYVQQGVGLPQVEVERLLLDLRRFLITRSFAGSVVLMWMSRHFKLVVAKKYLASEVTRREIHSKMADFLSHRVAGETSEPLLVRTGSELGESRRRLSGYPGVITWSFKCNGRTNLRKVIELPYHLQQSHRWEELECSLLMSPEFHQAMVGVGLLQVLVTMLQEGRWFLRERQLIAGALMCSAHLLQHVPQQLPAVMETNLFPYVGISGKRLEVVLFPAPASVPPIQSSLSASKHTTFSVAGTSVTQNGIIAVIMDDGSAWVWRDPAGVMAEVTLSCDREDLKFLEVKSSGHYLLFSTQCNRFLIWDVTGPEKFTQVEVREKQNPSLITANKIGGFVECQKTIFMWWKNESYVSVYNVDTEASSGLHCQSSVTCLSCSSGGRYVYCGHENGTVSVFDSHSCSLLGSSSSSTHNVVTLIIVSVDRREVACVDMIGNVALWDMTTQTEPLRLVKEVLIQGEPKNILNHDYSEEVSTLLVCQSHQITLWNTCKWEIWDQFLPPQGKSFTQAVLSQRGHLFLALLENCVLVLVWSISTGECVLSLNASEKPCTLLKTDTDLISVACDGSLTVWDARMVDAAGTALRTSYGVQVVLVGQKGEQFYTSDGSKEVWKWSLEAGVPQAFFVHDRPVEKVRLSSDNVYLVTLSAEDIYVWQTETGQNSLRISDSRATDVLIAPNNNLGVSVSMQGLSRVWRLTHGSIVCTIHLYLSSAKVSPESTFLIGFHNGDLLAANLWCGAVNKRFSCVDTSERVVAFHTISEQPDYVVVMAASGTVFTWNISEETVYKHFRLPFMIHCQLSDFQVSSDASYALLSTDNNTVKVLDLCQLRVYSFKAPGPVVTAAMDKCGRLAAYISLENICLSDQQAWHVLTVVRLSDGQRVGSVHLAKTSSSLIVCQQQCVYVGFQDGSVCVFSASGKMMDREKTLRENENVSGDEVKQCPCDSLPLSFVHVSLHRPNIIWT
uniref:NWD1/2-like winged helix-turn-helix domain-containing protein n=1 Tax=Cynoglossus semilaevis TaxID=244447 RepID=A0A3P8WMP2_CYNSE